ncbi:hypothetical protein A2160_01680 [Candidatus Beckwithbacteria bacterium RBG_13_42_9]|uniref:Uncharacterized protein n=1 Tax=Candidatus Beckwithbacteria bacterium RBG_13_42_9 TaxID=1797457 RepID=A0A1F5E917_9BACT|nr:MAG: hypothetical protein A2160_01680 [Candidatus Beckwithbacteria bacterium RBG_13_42_9]
MADAGTEGNAEVATTYDIVPGKNFGEFLFSGGLGGSFGYKPIGVGADGRIAYEASKLGLNFQGIETPIGELLRLQFGLEARARAGFQFLLAHQDKGITYDLIGGTAGSGPWVLALGIGAEFHVAESLSFCALGLGPALYINPATQVVSTEAAPGMAPLGHAAQVLPLSQSLRADGQLAAGLALNVGENKHHAVHIPGGTDLEVFGGPGGSPFFSAGIGVGASVDLGFQLSTALFRYYPTKRNANGELVLGNPVRICDLNASLSLNAQAGIGVAVEWGHVESGMGKIPGGGAFFIGATA